MPGHQMPIEACSMTGTARTRTQVEHLERSAMSRSSDPTTYEIRLAGHLDSRWAARFDGLALRLEPDGSTVLSGPIVDQAALHGLLQRVRDLGIELVSVTRPDFEPSTTGSEAEPSAQDPERSPR
jgi:hypothetical protein